MNRAVYGILSLFTLLLLFSLSTAGAEEPANRYSILFGWKTEGNHELLARQATALRQWKDTRTLAISFGALLGPTLIVRHDTADQYLRASRDAGFDYVIPAAPEFMFGVETLKRFAGNDDYPRFISANVVDKRTRRPVFDPYATWFVSGLRICVIAFSDTGIVRESKDVDLSGIDILSPDEALRNVSVAVARENADLVIAAGRLDRNDIAVIARKHPFVDIFLTNAQSGGFSDPKGTTTTAFYSGKPVYVGPETGNQIGLFSVRDREGIESREFASLTLGDAYPPEPEFLASLTRTLDEFKRRETEEGNIQKTGGAVASVLKSTFKVDTVLLERQSLFYFPLADSLTIFNVRRIIRPYTKLSVFSLTGAALKSILKDSQTRTDPDYRLIIAGMTADGKIDSIPAGDDTEYTVLTTTHLRAGGNGYPQFRAGTKERLTDINALAAVERFLVDKDERIRLASRPKNWNAVLNLSVASNFSKTDVDADKAAYGGAAPNQLRGLTDQFFGFLRLGSEGNSFSYKYRRHSFTSGLNMAYQRNGTKPSNGTILYRKANDYVKLSNHYEYDRQLFGTRPYIDANLNSILYSAQGKHPINGDVSTGLSRKFPKIWLTARLGMNGARDYFSNRSTLGTSGVLIFEKAFPAKSILTTPASFRSETNFNWYPTAQARHEFRHENFNRITFQLIKKLNLDINVRTYSYTNNTLRKTAFGVVYDLNLNYGMQWKL